MEIIQYNFMKFKSSYHTRWSLLIMMLLLASPSIFSQTNEEAVQKKGELYTRQLINVENSYTPITTIVDATSKKWLSEDESLFSVSDYEANGSYEHQTASIKLPELESDNQRINLHISEKYELESDYDLGKILVSSDKGESWEVVSIRSGKSELTTTLVNLTKYAGKKISIAFKLESDESNNYGGWTVETAALKKEYVGNPSARSFSTSLSSTSSLSGNFASCGDINFPDQISLLCSVNENGQAIANLDSSNFTVYEKIDSLWTYDTTWAEGVQYIEYRNSINAPLNFKVKTPEPGSSNKYVDIVFLMDNSGSMGDEQSAVKANVNSFLDSLQAKGFNARIGLVRFGQSTNSGQPIVVTNGAGSWWTNYGTSTSYDIDAFKSMWTSTNTHAGSIEPSYDALMTGIDASSYNFSSGSNKIFILITDEPLQGTNANYSTYTDSTVVIDALNNKDVTVYSLSLSSGYCLSDYGSISSGTGGSFYNILDPFDDILDDIAQQVNNNYEILYPPTRDIYDGLTRDVEIEVIYNGDTLWLTGQDYTPGAAPTIELTEQTIDTLHSYRPYLPNTDAPVEVYVYDYEAPRPHDGGAYKYVDLYYKNVNNPDDSYTQLVMSCDSILGVGDTAIWSVNIPGDSVLFPGIEYFIEASDSVTSTSSPTQTTQYMWTFAVAPNYAPNLTDSTIYLDATPVDTMIKTGYGIGDSITFRLHAFDSTVYLPQVSIYIKSPEDSQFDPILMDSIGNDIYTYTTVLKGGDTKYFFMATDDYGVSSWLATESNPFTIETTMEACADKHTVVFFERRPSRRSTFLTFGDEAIVAQDSVVFYVKDDKDYERKYLSLSANTLGENTVLACDDVNTAGKDGYTSGDEIIIKFWSDSRQELFDAYVSFDTDTANYDDLYFKDGGYTFLDTIAVFFQSTTVKKIDSYPYVWWSSYVDFDDYSFDAILDDYSTSIDWIEDLDGNTWTPSSSSNTLTTYTAGSGYEMRLASNIDSLQIELYGLQRDYSKESVSINIWSDGGSLLGCPYTSAESLVNIIGSEDVDAVSKRVGNNTYAYYPTDIAWSTWSTDLNVYPGEAYIFESANSSYNFTFPTATGVVAASVKTATNEIKIMPQTIRDYTQFMHLLIPDRAWKTAPTNGDVINVYSESEELIGQNYIFNNGTSMLIDGANLSLGETLEIRYKNSETGIEELLLITEWEKGEATYEPNKMAVAAKVESESALKNSEFSINKVSVYPNPTSDFVNAEIELSSQTSIAIKLTDVSGTVIYTMDATEYAAGEHTITIPVNLNSGLYTLNLVDDKGNNTALSVIIK